MNFAWGSAPHPGVCALVSREAAEKRSDDFHRLSDKPTRLLESLPSVALSFLVEKQLKIYHECHQNGSCKKRMCP